MSNPFLSLFEDPKQLELVRTITEKTQQGKLLWNKSTTSYEARLPNGVGIAFALSSPALPFLKTMKTWAHFIVRARDGSEILKVQHSMLAPAIPGFPEATKSPLETGVEKLFAIVDNTAKSEVDKVIDQLKNL